MKVYALSDDQLDDLIKKAVDAAIEKYTKPDRFADLPERLSMKQAMAVSGYGRVKLLSKVAKGELMLASNPGEKYKFYKKNILQLI